jgi:hypothetical protein
MCVREGVHVCVRVGVHVCARVGVHVNVLGSTLTHIHEFPP